ncbi:MAG: ATP-dependent DNA helicase RecG [Bacillota bacterium]
MLKLTEISGIGKITFEKLKKHSIYSIEDLLYAFPKKYKINKLDSLDKAKLNQETSLTVKVKGKPKIYFIRKNLTKLTFKALSGKKIFNVTIFNRHFLSKSLFINQNVVITGKFKNNFDNFTASDLVLKKNYQEGIIPIYNLGDIPEGRVKKIINNTLNLSYRLEETTPKYLLEKHKLPEINTIITSIHKPKSKTDLAKALYRLKYDELLNFSLRIELINEYNNNTRTELKKYNISLVREFINSLPFELTQDQKQATNEIFKDLKSTKQMNRLLQGDVGSGKTIVALLAALAIVSADYQVAIMAPTLVLAKQHFLVFKNYLHDFGINIALLTSEVNSKKRVEIINGIENQNVNIIIGTHALIQTDLNYQKLGLVIIDEQHRFGVEQRKILREKGLNPDILLMSATPIPRSLAISIFESSDISQIKEKPAGRQTVKTEIVNLENLNYIYSAINKELEKNHQIYFICPLINESDNNNYYSVNETYNLLLQHFDEKILSYLHGKMTDEEKTKVLDDFYSNKTKILISTTVIEVGIDVEKASMMVIMNANAFGLAQLHQLRGRIGRNNLQSYCYLAVDEENEQKERINILKNHYDGFEISEMDLKLRGPGEVFGKNQAGIPNFNYANIIEDKQLLSITKADAKTLIRNNDYQAKKLTEKIIKTLDSYNLD